MHAGYIGTAILAAVAAVATGSAVAACTSCPETEVVRDDTKDVPTSVACASLNGTSRTGPACADLCDSSYNVCFVDAPYIQVWSNAVSAAASDGGTASSAPCPAPADGRTVVKVRCRETQEGSELQPGFSCTRVVEGRRSDNLLSPLEIEDLSSLGGYFASVAHLEAAAVLAFGRMIDELCAHGAPHDLVEDARLARKDEIRHARATAKLARRFGGNPHSARCTRASIRDLFAIALENEVEGVVRETFGAALATWRAENADDADVRAAMIVIARDERRHAELSWRIAEWARDRLGAKECGRLDEARSAAIADLRSAFSIDPSRDVMHIAGVPSKAATEALIATLDCDVWRANAA